ncbi:glycosyltransferase involved in cell wall biosynthesis [Microbacteriaceae bacterium SG_E_30_P1]|uniref:Glycosyltransferase involved in cell wall biosynthesis n=1 Tax=Antiquaquibacter oligotrophicus TaxID=2880260 RepID=A0ABT6KP01_9MICO|nr:glycosyltransferase [Antiquaquibacter oligotrophicus]MDH6181732.1 glycosyltransferase involved in cell wall biosynthesis [Antiquaquibacter oligotrophicus]UDF12585.1 glycosyltransferase [Antiquaquibacter oligotrophicus]
MTTLRVILDDMVSGKDGSAKSYASELTAALIEAAPRGCIVEGFVAASPEPDYDAIADRLPGLRHLHKSALARRELTAAWQHGFTRLPGSGLVHAASLLAPLGRHDRVNDGDQISVTVRDTLAWTRPDELAARSVAWHKAMLKRAERYADAIVVPNHVVAQELAEIANIGDRLRVIAGAPTEELPTPADVAERAERLSLPEKFVMTVGESESPSHITSIVRAMSHVHDAIDLVIAEAGMSDEELASAADAAGLRSGRVRALGSDDPADTLAAIARADVLAHTTPAVGFGLPILNAFALGTPVVHTDDPEALELAVDAGITVERDGNDFDRRLADGINTVFSDESTAQRLRYAGIDRAKAYTWRGAAEKVWQLHADL